MRKICLSLFIARPPSNEHGRISFSSAFPSRPTYSRPRPEAVRFSCSQDIICGMCEKFVKYRDLNVQSAETILIFSIIHIF